MIKDNVFFKQIFITQQWIVNYINRMTHFFMRAQNILQYYKSILQTLFHETVLFTHTDMNANKQLKGVSYTLQL